MSNREYVKTQIDILPDSAVDKVTEFISFLIYTLEVVPDGAETPVLEHANTWGELDRVVSQMDELPRFEDFPRSDFGRWLISFNEVM